MRQGGVWLLRSEIGFNYRRNQPREKSYTNKMLTIESRKLKTASLWTPIKQETQIGHWISIWVVLKIHWEGKIVADLQTLEGLKNAQCPRIVSGIHTLNMMRLLLMLRQLHKSRIMWVWQSTQKLLKITDTIWNLLLALKSIEQIERLTGLLIWSFTSHWRCVRLITYLIRVQATGLVTRGQPTTLSLLKAWKRKLVMNLVWLPCQITRNSLIVDALRIQSTLKTISRPGTKFRKWSLCWKLPKEKVLHQQSSTVPCMFQQLTQGWLWRKVARNIQLK